MKTGATLIGAAFVTASATIALAQGAGGGGGVRGALVLAPEQRTIVKEYVTSHKVAPVKLKERISVGATLPASVRLAPVPAEWGRAYSSYRYVYSDNRVYFVEPSTRRVVTEID
jgi:hypothetical protein